MMKLSSYTDFGLEKCEMGDFTLATEDLGSP